VPKPTVGVDGLRLDQLTDRWGRVREAELCMEEDWLAECAVQDVAEQGWQVGWEEFVAAGYEFGVGPPAVLDEAGLLVGGVLGPQDGRGVGDTGEIDALASVMITTAVVEAGLAVPEVRSDVVKKDAGLLGELATGGIGKASPGLAPPPGSSHQWWSGSSGLWRG
jgi:hypothetical protein